MTGTIGWGFIGTGRIARGFAENLRSVPDARLAAVGSRSADTARSFADAYGDPGCRSHASYDALVADHDVDVVYVASPHALHPEHTRLALEAGKPVLCEKALALNAADAEDMVALARERGLFLMEAMWMACHPTMRSLIAALESGRLGQPRQVHADLGFLVEADPEDRLLDPALGAGALLDMGVYPLTFAHLVLGPAEQVAATAGLAPSGIDLDLAVSARYAGGAVAALTSSMTSWSPRSATIATDAGLVELPASFHHPSGVRFTPSAGGDPVAIEPEGALLGTGLGNEAAEVMRCLREGLLESPLVPHEQTLSLMRTMDDIREQIGVRYPSELA